MAKMLLTTVDQSWRVDLHQGESIALPLNFDGPQPNPFGVSPATRKPIEAGTFVGSTERGGSCNCDHIELIPHCHGTHTETISHIIHQLIPVHAVAPVTLIAATLVSVAPVDGSACSETYRPSISDNDRVITREALELVWQSQRLPDSFRPLGLIVRTQPNDPQKSFGGERSLAQPYFTNEAMAWIVENQIEHLFVDFPSVDRLNDDGLLSNHHLYWNVEPQTRIATPNSRINATITEMVYIGDHVEDGPHLMSLQVAPLALDAAPSRPVIFRVLTE